MTGVNNSVTTQVIEYPRDRRSNCPWGSAGRFSHV